MTVRGFEATLPVALYCPKQGTQLDEDVGVVGSLRVGEDALTLAPVQMRKPTRGVWANWRDYAALEAELMDAPSWRWSDLEECSVWFGPLVGLAQALWEEALAHYERPLPADADRFISSR
ncbi:MAG: hypothetical protein H6729_08425 [Deltaproteobacteria bacterium]|nr:hypothetical protein [Deltaproteobacteria bacterium]